MKFNCNGCNKKLCIINQFQSKFSNYLFENSHHSNRILVEFSQKQEMGCGSSKEEESKKDKGVNGKGKDVKSRKGSSDSKDSRSGKGKGDADKERDKENEDFGKKRASYNTQVYESLRSNFEFISIDDLNQYISLRYIQDNVNEEQRGKIIQKILASEFQKGCLAIRPAKKDCFGYEQDGGEK